MVDRAECNAVTQVCEAKARRICLNGMQTPTRHNSSNRNSRSLVARIILRLVRTKRKPNFLTDSKLFWVCSRVSDDGDGAAFGVESSKDFGDGGAVSQSVTAATITTAGTLLVGSSLSL